MALVQGSQRLLAFLALHYRPLPRPYVAGTLWGDSSEQRAAGNLRTALWRLHCCGLHLVDQSHGHLALSSDVVVDVVEAHHFATELMNGASVRVAALNPTLFEGELLTGWYDDWVIVERERHRQLSAQALELLCERLALEGRHAQAVRVGLSAVECDPLRESAHRALIKAHLAQGNVQEAIHQFRRYGDLLRRELGIGPSMQIKSLFVGIAVE